MRRQEQQLDRPAAGYLPVSLFNQRKRNRIPLKSVPGENEFFSPSEYMASTSSAASVGPSATYECYQASDSSPSAPQSHQWNRKGVPESAKPQQYGNRPAPGPSAMRTYAPIPHPYKAGTKSSMTGQPSNPAGQWVLSSGVSPRHSQIQHPYGNKNTQSKPVQHAGFSQTAQQSSNKQIFPARQFSHESRPLPPPVEAPPPSMLLAQAAQQPNKSWKFTNSFEHQKSNFIAKKSSNQPPTSKPTKNEKESIPAKKPMENSLRILTTVINGMRHWSQFKDKIPYLFEIFGTLDSAVTLGRYGAKSFLLRDGKDVLQCVFYENEQLLPRLIRGQVHRCVGNYDRSRDVLICVSVRAGQPSEQRNALEAVKVSDAEMRALVKILSEV
ncbi:spermatogenesis-associated protein 22 isoform X1 [Gambusia affinis]|uniref:spermatogenesis-associated protein 22 isoform X1 n=1 Tax=Gambusia affinis TaxID=33528 RepID=UPI001CDB610F|nr:spermatogenesis-associated protein 22 isoform X1 [Gambusia affinis]XP_043995649.1 spermatogenesis-associated protein 22 isoform X1 [Gambusia affinis]XP_043995650.1 spermatogenesis-associated protein 22 isoform X1 [Gambusia affinis]